MVLVQGETHGGFFYFVGIVGIYITQVETDQHQRGPHLNIIHWSARQKPSDKSTERKEINKQEKSEDTSRIPHANFKNWNYLKPNRNRNS